MKKDNAATFEFSLRFRLIAFCLAMAMIIMLLPDLITKVVAENEGGFTIDLSWNNYTAEDGENDTFIYYSNMEESKAVRLKISYTMKNTTGEFKPGSIVITVNGLKDAVRSPSTAYIPDDGGVAADPINSDNQSHEWSYSYSSSQDMFTFTNNNLIDGLKTFEGSFEIMWILPSRETKDGIVNTFTAYLTANGETYDSNTLTYKQFREKDEYTVNIERQKVDLDSTMTPADLEGYSWAVYDVTATDMYYARDVAGLERFEVYFPADAKVYGAGLELNENKTLESMLANYYGLDSDEIKEYLGENYEVAKDYVCWQVYKDVDPEEDPTYLKNIKVAYPQGVKTYTTYAYVLLAGAYYEEEDKNDSLLAYHKTSFDVNPDDELKDLPGPKYELAKESYGVHSAYIDSTPRRREHGAINSLHLANGKGTYFSNLLLELHYNRQWADTYDLEFYDDFLEITDKNGGYRLLRDDEYHFTQVIIPSNTRILNDSGEPLEEDKYNVAVYVRYAGHDHTDYERITNDRQLQRDVQIITLPPNVVGVKVVYERIDQSISEKTVMARVDYAFNIADKELDSIITDGGKVVNNMFFLLFGNRGDERKWWNPYTVNGGVYQNDYDLGWYFTDKDGALRAWFEDEYPRGELSEDYTKLRSFGLDRASDYLDIVEIPNEFKVADVNISKTGETRNTYEFAGSIRAQFILDNSTDVTEFSLYTVVPEGLRLTESLDSNGELLKEVLHLKTSDKLDEAFLLSNLNVEIKEIKGRQFIAFNFNFTDQPIHSSWIEVSGLPMYVEKENLVYGSCSYTLTAGMLVHQMGRWQSGGVDDRTSENGIWFDMDGDEDTKEPASFLSDTVSFVFSEYTHVELTKMVQTSLTDGPVKVDGTDMSLSDSEIPMTYMGGEYSYILQAVVGSGSSIKNIVFADVIEPMEGKEWRSEWQGEFVDVDYSALLKAVGYVEGKDEKPTVYYSAQVETFEPIIIDNGQTKSTAYIVNREALQKGGWTTDKDSLNGPVRSVAVDFGELEAKEGTVLSITIHMTAPTDSALNGKIARNSCNIGYIKQDKNTGKFETPEYLPSNVVPVKLTNSGMLVLTKRDLTDKKVLSGAVFDLYKVEDGKERLIGSDYTVKENGRLVITGLDEGEYRLVETKAPKGYEIGEPLEFTIDKQNLSIVLDYPNERKKGKFTILKVSDMLAETVLEGAVFDLYKAGEEEAFIKDLKTGEDGKLTVKDLEWGDYYLIETKAPDGYELPNPNNPIKFTIDAENGTDDLEDVIDATVKNHQKPVSVELLKYELAGDKYGKVPSKLKLSDIDTGAPVKGAIYELWLVTESGAKKITTSVTDSNGRIRVDDLAYGTYYFKEISSAKGYEVNEELIWFKLTKDDAADEKNVNKVVTLLTADPRKTVEIELVKYDDKYVPVKDGVYVLYEQDEQGTDIPVPVRGSAGSYTYDPTSTETKMVTDENGRIKITEVVWGKYYLKEVEAPRGYELDTRSLFIPAENQPIDQSNYQESYTVDSMDNRIKGKVQLKKVEENKLDAEGLDGAVFDLYKGDGTLYRGDLTTKNGGIIFEDELEWGSYYFVETKAPDGYGLNEQKIRFSVNYLTAGKTQYLTVEDPPINYLLTITKRITNNDVVLAHGNPTFIFEVTKTDEPDKGHTYRKSVTFNELSISKDKDTSEMSVIFTVPKGTYDVSEISVNRYELDYITSDSKCVTVEKDANGKATKATVTFSGKPGEDADTSITLVFANEKTDQEGTSDTAIRPNILKTARKLTAVIADYSGDTILDGETTDTEKLKEDLTVFAVYDDGTQKELKAEEYELNPKEFDPNMPGEYTVEVSYTDNKITRSDSFTVMYKGNQVFRWDYLEKFGEPKQSSNGIEYYGKIYIYGYTGTSSTIHFPAYLVDPEDDKVYKVVQIGMAGKNFNYVLPPDASYTSTTKPYLDENYEKNVFQFGDKVPNKLELTFAEGIETISDCVFSVTGKTIEGDLVFPNTVSYIGEFAFNNRDNSIQVTGVKIPGSVNTIGKLAFNVCSELKTVEFGDSGLTVDYNSLSIEEKKSTWIIGDYAFYNCTKLTGELKIPNWVTTIGEFAFLGCSNLTSLKLGNSVNTISKRAFSGCSGLSGELIIPDSVEKILYAAFAYCRNLSSLELGESLWLIDEYAFQECFGFKGDLIIPDSVTTIGQYAFSSCSGFSGILKLSERVTAIGTNTFSSCSGFTGNLIIPESVTSIGSSAFNGCKGFTGDLIIPESVRDIGSNAFQFCDGLKGNLVINGQIPTLTSDMFSHTSFKGDLVIGAGVKTIGANAFQDGVFTGSLYINGDNPDGVIIEANAFRRVWFTGEIDLSSVISIGNQAFYQDYANKDNAQVNKLTFGDGLTSIGVEAFAFSATYLNNKTYIQGIVILPPSLTSLGTGNFNYDNGLTIYIPEKLPNPPADLANQVTSRGATIERYDSLPDLKTKIGDDTKLPDWVLAQSSSP